MKLCPKCGSSKFTQLSYCKDGTNYHHSYHESTHDYEALHRTCLNCNYTRIEPCKDQTK